MRNIIKKHIGIKLVLTVAVLIVIGMAVTTLFSTQQQAKLLSHENEGSMKKLTETVVQGITTIMLAGYADIAQSYADNLRKVPEIVDIRVIRPDGLEAFRDNLTIDDVNLRRGDEEFLPREEDELSENRVLNAEHPKLLEALQNESSVSFYETQDDGTRLLTFLGPILNQSDCHTCHGSNHPVRGVVKLTTSVQAAEEAIQRNTLVSASVAGGITLLVVVLIGVVVRKLSNPILDVSHSLHAISAEGGDLTVELEVKSLDEVGQLSSSFNLFLRKLRNIISSVSESSRSLTQVAEQAAQLAKRANQAVSSQEEHTHQVASMSMEMAQSTGQVASHSEQAARVANEVHQLSLDGKEQVRTSIDASQQLLEGVIQASDAMNRLSDNMKGIDVMLDVVKGVAEQTNLLALNASIEAARAGEHGRGFAVVADEVRALARRTQQSTEEIGALVKKLEADNKNVADAMIASQKSAEFSMAQANRSGEFLDHIAGSSTQIDALNRQIAEELQRQLDMTASIDKALSSINEYAAHSSEATQDMAERSGELAHLAEQLQKLIHQFRY